MLNAQKRNHRFTLLVSSTKKTPFGQRILELRAFADGAGCGFRFDSNYFELWSNNVPSARLVFRAPV